jgi:hypothetical protein
VIPLVQRGMPLTKALEYLDFPIGSFYAYLKERPSLKRKIERAKKFMRVMAENIVAESIREGQEQGATDGQKAIARRSAKWWLSRKIKTEYAPTVYQEQSVKTKGILASYDLKKLPLKKRKQMLKDLLGVKKEESE